MIDTVVIRQSLCLPSHWQICVTDSPAPYQILCNKAIRQNCQIHCLKCMDNSYFDRNNQWPTGMLKQQKWGPSKSNRNHIICGVNVERVILTLAGPSEYQCNWSCGPPRTLFLFLPVIGYISKKHLNTYKIWT